MAYQSAREMLSRFPMKMAEGGSVDANQLVLDFITNNPDASVEAIATQINNSGADLYSLADSLNIDRSIAQEAYDEANALNQTYLDAETRVMGEINANPAAFNAADAYKEILIADAASERGVNVQGALDAGVAQSTIDRIFTTPAGSPAYTGPAPTATMSAGVQDYYNTVMADGEVDAAERLAMQKIATDQGLSYNDILAAGVDPNILYNTPAVEPIVPVVPDPVVPVVPDPVVPDPFPQTQVPYTAPTVYQPLPDNTSVYAAGEESLDRTFRDSDPRTEVLDPYGNLVNFDYTPGASLRSATGSGYNFTPPTVTSRPRSLMGADLLARYTGGRAAADLRQLTTGLGNGRSYSDYTGVLQNPGAYSGGLSKSQLYSRMRGMDYNRDRAARSTRATGTIADYLAKYEDVRTDYARAMEAGELLPGTTLESFGRDHYNKYGRFDRPFTLIEAAGDTGGGVTIGDPINGYVSAGMGGFGEGDEESRQQDYTTSNFEQAQRAARSLGEAGGVYRPFAQGGPVKKPKGFADGGSASADLKALDPTDPLFITETVQEVNPDNIQRDIPPMEWDGVERPTGQETSKNMLENILSGAGKIPESVANYFVRPDETGGPSLVSPRQVGSDIAALGGAMKEGLKEDPVGFALDVLPVTGEIRSGMDVDKFSTMANEARAAGDTKAADLYEQIVTLSAAGTLPLMGLGARAGRRAAINAAEEAIKKGALGDAAKMLDEVEEAIDLYPQSNSQRTQLGSSTVPSYEKARKVLGEGKTLDFGAGRGEGAEKIGADTFEPYPRKGFDPTYSSAADIPDAKYKNITSLNVLNVMPRSVRDEAVNHIGRILKPGGKAVVTTRGRDVLNAKGDIGPEPMSIFTTNDTYQKGFTQPELRNYIQGQLGEGFVISNLPEKIGQAGVLIKKRPSIKAADRAMAGRKAEKIIASQPTVKASEALGQLMEQGFRRTSTTQADRTRVGGGNIGGAAFPAISQADPNYAGKVWGVMDSGTASRLTNLTSPETAWTTMLGSATQLKTNPLVFDKLKKGFVDSMKAGNLSPELAEKININLAVTFGKGADIRDPKIWSQADTFEKRAALADIMMGQGLPPSKGGVSLGGEKSGKGVIFKPTEILIKETEKALLHPVHGGDAPTFAAGPRLFSLDGTAEYRPDLHPGFPTLLGGRDLGVSMQPTPTEVYLPDWHRQFKADNPSRKGPGYYDLALGVKGKGLPSQELTDEYIRHLLREGFSEGGEVKNPKGSASSDLEELGKYAGGGLIEKAIQKGAEALGFDDERQVAISEEAVELTNQMVDAGLIGEQYRVELLMPENVSQRTRQNTGIKGDEEVFNAVNHALFAYDAGQSTLGAMGAQAKELYQGLNRKMGGSDPRSEYLDYFNNKFGFNLAEQGLSRQEAKNAIMDTLGNINNQGTRGRMTRGEPIKAGVDLLTNVQDAKYPWE